MKIFELKQTRNMDLMRSPSPYTMKFSLMLLLITLSLILSWTYAVHASEPHLATAPSALQAQTLLANIGQGYGTYLGGSSDDIVRAVTMDEQGNIYLTGSTYSTDFPGLNGKQNDNEDIFVMRLNPQGTAVIWSVYFGGSDSEAGRALALDGQGSLWVTGYTASSDFPISPGSDSFAGFYDVVAIKLNAATGAKQYSAVYGSENLDEGNGIAISPTTGQVYITGQFSDEFNRSNVLIMSLDGQSYDVQALASFGRERGRDVGNAIALDAEDNIYITGQTEPSGQDTDFPLSADPFQDQCGMGDVFDCGLDAFVTIIDPDVENILYSTYLGGSYNNSQTGSGGDVGTGIGVGADGSVYVTGYTFATDFPVANALQPTKRGSDNFTDAFVVRLNPVTNDLIFSTYLGGDDWEEAHALSLDNEGNVYIAGLTNALNFPIQDAVQPTLGPGVCNLGGSERYCYDGFATKLTAAGVLDWSTYMGGGLDDNAYGLVVDSADELLLVGGTKSADFPVSTNALQPNKGLSQDGFLVRLGSGGGVNPGSSKIYLSFMLGG